MRSDTHILHSRSMRSNKAHSLVLPERNTPSDPNASPSKHDTPPHRVEENARLRKIAEKAAAPPTKCEEQCDHEYFNGDPCRRTCQLEANHKSTVCFMNRVCSCLKEHDDMSQKLHDRLNEQRHHIQKSTSPHTDHSSTTPSHKLDDIMNAQAPTSDSAKLQGTKRMYAAHFQIRKNMERPAKVCKDHDLHGSSREDCIPPHISFEKRNSRFYRLGERPCDSRRMDWTRNGLESCDTWFRSDTDPVPAYKKPCTSADIAIRNSTSASSSTYIRDVNVATTATPVHKVTNVDNVALPTPTEANHCIAFWANVYHPGEKTCYTIGCKFNHNMKNWPSFKWVQENIHKFDLASSNNDKRKRIDADEPTTNATDPTKAPKRDRFTCPICNNYQDGTSRIWTGTCRWCKVETCWQCLDNRWLCKLCNTKHSYHKEGHHTHKPLEKPIDLSAAMTYTSTPIIPPIMAPDTSTDLIPSHEPTTDSTSLADDDISLHRSLTPLMNLQQLTQVVDTAGENEMGSLSDSDDEYIDMPGLEENEPTILPTSTPGNDGYLAHLDSSSSE